MQSPPGKEFVALIEEAIQCKEASIASIMPPRNKEPDKIDEFRISLYSLFDAIKIKGFRALVDCAYNLVMRLVGRDDKGSACEIDGEESDNLCDGAEVAANSDSTVVEEYVPGIQILDVINYMICPPVSGGMLRILAPFKKMTKGCGISVDMVFGTWDDSYAESCEAYLNNIPVINYSKGVVLPMYTKDIPGIPEGLPKDVWITVSKRLLDGVIERISNKKYDIIQIEHSQLSWMVPAIRSVSPESKIVLDAHNVEYRVYETWLPYAEKSNLADVRERYETMKNWERASWSLYDSAFVVSDVEHEILNAAGVRTVYSVPTGGGIDIEKYCSNPECEKPYDLLYIGSMNWFPNYHGLIWFLREVFPLVKEKKPDVNFQIVGNGDPDSKLLSIISKTSGVKFWGFQNDDVSFFQRSKVFLVPLWIGAGARVKIPTAWATGTPIVSTVFGAEGLMAENGKNILMSDEPQKFAEDILSLLGNPELARMISENAVDTVKKYYRVEYCAEKLIEDYHDILDNN